ncbi:hypothetical protein [Gimesia panareensis]|uniref:Uncharacterized protein n=1 Tax=Gimesia panareensis TaxID=2527978 RepID=A0A517Q4S6_9PLAN|nr:hypothetical protein [Gimesia panareensis]QDT26624.1 hypothetical protein Enr10x_19290 [Gimesia panareensis]QDU50467.1 hypothetical protein Pan110_28180 [Gimesia panareensis]
MAKITGKQIIKSVLFTAAGAAPGVIWIINAGTTQSIVIACLGAAVGFGLSLPGVSAARVAGGTVGVIAARNAPLSMQDKILDTFIGEGETPENEQESEENQRGDSAGSTA